MFKLNYKFLLLFLINLNFSFSFEYGTKEFRENLIAQWKSDLTAVPIGQRSKRAISINNSDDNDDDDLNSRSLVVIASEIDNVERALKPVDCLIKCVANANELYLVSDNTLFADEINDQDQIEMYNRIKRSVGISRLDLHHREDEVEAAKFIKHKRDTSGTSPLKTKEKVADNSYIVVFDKNTIYPPQVMINPRDLKIDTNEGDSFQINCTGSSVENASFKWLDPKGETLTELNGLNGNVEHYFDGIDISETGSYTCTGQNQYGTAKQVLQIKVKPSRLTAHIMPTNNYLAETNMPYTLYCKIPIEFNRKSIITWSYDNQTAIGNSNLAISNTALIIKKLNRKSNGIYSCSVRMNKIIKSDYIDLKVEYAPEILGQPRITQKLHLRYDTNFTLSCDIANAVPEPVVVWDITLRHNKENIQRDLPYLPNPDIVFNGFKPTDEGTYTCYGENHLGKTKIRTFHIFGQASVKPMIKNTEEFPEKSKKIVVMKDDTVKFLTCQCENCMPIKSIKWFYNGNEITKVDSKPIVYEETYVGNDKVGLLPLTKTNIKKSEEGEYKCYIENEFGSDTFTFDVQVVDFEATEGLDETANATQIKCELEEDKIYPVVIYGENDETLLGYNATSNKYENVSATGYGQKYKCETYKLVYSKNPGFKLGTSPLDTFDLFTIIPNITDTALLSKVATDDQPDYKICKFNNTENLNEPNLVRSCETDGEPLIVMSSQESEYPQLNQDIELYKNIYITSKTNLFLYLCDLLPYSEKITDKLSYICSHTSELGFGQQQFLLYRREKPSVSDTVKDHIKILPGSKELISCDGFGNPEPKVYWTSPNGEKFEQIPEYPNKLEFSIVDEEIAGNYTCNAENIYGLSTKQTYVEIINVPKVIGPNNYREIAASPCQLKELVCPIKNAKNFTWTRTLEHEDSEVFQMNFNGNYTCVGENEAGVSDFTFIVRDADVLRPLRIAIHLSSPESKIFNDLSQTDSITTEIDKPLTAQCVVESGIPTSDIRWLKDNQEYNSEETIEIIALQPDDIGEYTCIAGNELGQVTKSFQVNLLAPPKFKYDLGDKQTLPLAFGTSTSLDCTAFASPQPSFNWYFNGVLLQNESQDTYRLENVSGYTAGMYQCYVQNPLGSIEREFVVETRDPLPKPHVPDAVEITQPEQLRLPCTIEYSPSLSNFKWIFNGQYILSHDDPLDPLGPNEKIYFLNSRTLYSTEAEAADSSNSYGVFSKSSDGSELTFELVIQKTKFDENSGVYTCYITNSVNAIESAVSVNVLTEPEPDESLEVNVIVPEYTQKSFDCLVKGNPETDTTWDLNGERIDQTTDPTILIYYYGRVLRFTNITQQHSGKLRCTGVNRLGTHTHVFNVNVEGPPKIIHPENNTIDERQVEDIIIDPDVPITVQCPYIGNPTPNIKWHMVINDNHELLNEIGDSITVGPLKSSASVYCALDNGVGFLKKKFNLLILSSLRFTAIEKEQPVRVTLGNYILLNCTMEGTPSPEVQWTKDGEKIPDYDKFIYYVQNAVEDDRGRYTCVGSNNVEEISRDFDVVIDTAEWDEWSEWSTCNTPCGVGSQHRERRCLLNGKEARGLCDGDEVEVYECVQRPCSSYIPPQPHETPEPSPPSNPSVPERSRYTPPPTDTSAPERPIYSPPPPDTPEPGSNPSVPQIWGPWSECDLSCHDTINKRNSMRKRMCIDPSLIFCNGRHHEMEKCRVPNCPIHGGWGAWITSQCSVTCGEGIATRRRYCNSPSPKHNGRTCQGKRIENFACKKLCT